MSECENIDFKTADVFHFDSDACNFNDVARNENNFTYWYERDYMYMLGYESVDMFSEIIDKAFEVYKLLNFDTDNDFKGKKREFEGKEIDDIMFSRFACYLISMFADDNFDCVVKSREYFNEISKSIKRYVDDPDDVERIFLRALLAKNQNLLFAAISQAGLNVDSCTFIQNNGCHGMYKMNVDALKKYRKIRGNGRQYDFMTRYELELNCSRIEDTLLEIETNNLKNEDEIALAAQIVGLKYRNQYHSDTKGKWYPENLEKVEDIKKIITSLTQTYKRMLKMDS